MNIDADLLQFYLYKKLIRKKDAETILAESERLHIPVREYLLAKEYVTEATELEALAEYYCMPYVEVDMLEIDKSLFERFSLDYMKRNKFLPVSIDKNGVLLLAVGKPLDFCAMTAVSAVFCCPIDVVLTPPVQIDRYIDSISAVISTSAALSDLNTESDDKLFADIKSGDEGIASADDVVNNPAVRLVDSIIKEAIPYRASDIHIEPFEKKVRVRYRIDGDLQERASFPIEAYSAICARIKIMSGLNIAERRVPQDGRINMRIGGKEYDFRVSSLPSVHGEKFVIRILDKTSFRFTRQDLGFTDEENVVIDRMLEQPHGIILLTGPYRMRKVHDSVFFPKGSQYTDREYYYGRGPR